ncbi:DUF3301 domain-containing protein [Nitrincola tapanii]|uniref:DUF3301 domain-containing protein n=1 Tax=Nitrincola tapanii TaxID=1708751 RepID=A0A5A9W4T6_9GAMM|nr:DUF3301 domain-containing protein [Nitrincola tapanii]KAA0875165.1 DUF3301 domain-containing protein [Nitrincola tapanii]
MRLDLIDLIFFTLLAALLMFWWQNLKKREAVFKAVKRYCQREHLQLLDESVALEAMGLKRHPETGYLLLTRRYRFEFTSTGDERYQGRVFLSGAQIDQIEVEAHRVDAP